MHAETLSTAQDKNQRSTIVIGRGALSRLSTRSGGFKEGRAGSAPLFRWRTDAVTHGRPYSLHVTTVLYYGDTIASFSLQTRKTWHSEYSKWLPPVAFWQLQSAPYSFWPRLRPGPRWGSLQRSPRHSSWIYGGLLLRGGKWGWKKTGSGETDPLFRKLLDPPLTWLGVARWRSG